MNNNNNAPTSIDRKALAAALNAIEAGSNEAEAAIEAAWLAPHGSVIGITGPPGVGKSTLAGRLVAAWRARGSSVAALCIDPSSKRSGGALLGDRLRMRLSGDDPDVFVRSMAARGHLGGLAPKAFEAVTAMRAAAERVLVETVGVGQSEVEVARLADVTAVVIQPGSGDALQFLKAGLMEVFDLLVVNKADLGALAEDAARELRSALRVQGRREVPVVLVSAETGAGVDGLLAVIETLAQAQEARREEVLGEVMLERFAHWHGEKLVQKLGGRLAIAAQLAAVPPSPKRYREALEALAEGHAIQPAVSPSAPEAMGKPWHGELEVDDKTARALVGGIAPELAHIVPERLGEGWDNSAWIFRQESEAWVFRFPRRAVAVPFLTRELDVLPRLASRLPLPVTAARWRGRMDNGWPFGGYRYLEGDMAAVCGLGDADKVALARVWGGFVRALHDVDARALGVELPVDPLGKVDVPRRWDLTSSSLAQAGALDEAAVQVLQAARTAFLTMGPRPRVVCHGDLDGRHVIVARRDGVWHATGIIDWGDVMLGDPATDLGIAYSFLEGEARAAFFEAYGPIDATSEALARFRALATQVWVLSWARDLGHVAHGAEARQALARATR